jgi:hypothetical protein
MYLLRTRLAYVPAFQVFDSLTFYPVLSFCTQHLGIATPIATYTVAVTTTACQTGNNQNSRILCQSYVSTNFARRVSIALTSLIPYSSSVLSANIVNPQ